MAREQLANIDDGAITLASGVNNSATSLTLGGPYSLLPTSNFRLRLDDELVLVGSRSGASCSSVTRGVEGSAAASHTTSAVVSAPITAAGFYGAMPGATALEAVMSTSPGYQDLTSSLADIAGLSLSLPEAGTYLVSLVIRSSLTIEAAAVQFVVAQLVDGSGTPYGSRPLLPLYAENHTGSTCTYINQVGYTLSVTVTGAATVKLQAKYGSAGSNTYRIQSDVSGASLISAVRVA